MIRFTILLVFLLASSEDLLAQQPSVNTTVQLPTVSSFNINTVVSVPDGGTMFLGGGAGGAAYSSRRPGLRSSARSIGGPGVSVSTTLIIGSEVDAELERRGRIAIARNARPEIHGSDEEKARAEFLAKHLGRGWK